MGGFFLGKWTYADCIGRIAVLGGVFEVLEEFKVFYISQALN
jgi:hypothetical protein